MDEYKLTLTHNELAALELLLSNVRHGDPGNKRDPALASLEIKVLLGLDPSSVINAFKQMTEGTKQ